MTDEERNRDTAHWPSKANIVSLCFVVSLPTLINNNPDSGIASSRSRRIERGRVSILL